MAKTRDTLKVDKFVVGVLESSHTTPYDIEDRSKTEKTFVLTYDYYKRAQEQGESYLLILDRVGRPVIKLFVDEMV